MGALHFQAVVGTDHRIEIALPASVPAGPVDVVVNVPDGKALPPGLSGEALEGWLEDLRKLREKFKDRGVTLSDAVIANRREERY